MVTALESVPFVDFLIGESFVVVERDRPDSQGARKLIIALSAIMAVKLSTPDSLATLAGFTQASVEAADDFSAADSLASRAAAAVKRSGDFTRRPL